MSGTVKILLMTSLLLVLAGCSDFDRDNSMPKKVCTEEKTEEKSWTDGGINTRTYCLKEELQCISPYVIKKMKYKSGDDLDVARCTMP